MEKKPFHETVAEKLIELLKQGTAPWQIPWESGATNQFVPNNPITGNRYKGVNAIHLMAQGYNDQRWMTYKQAQSVDAQVRKGEKGTAVQYWKFTEEQIKKDESGKPLLDDEGQPVKEIVNLERPKVFFATVFNAEQIDGLPPIQRKEPQWNVSERAEQILRNSGANINHDVVNRAFYRPSSDSIHLPEKSAFLKSDNYYATALHELGHWTGHASRLNRDLAHPFGSEEYAKEELRAEISSMILGDELGIGHNPEQHAAYVGSWIKVLQDDPLEIFRAAADAEKIQAYVLAFEQVQVEEKNMQQSQVEDIKPLVMDTEFQHEKIYIDVPYKEKDEAKSLGARWDRQQQSWYISTGVDSELFSKWAVVSESKALQQSTRQYLVVPYTEREQAKNSGALWDKSAKSWYAGQNADMEKLQRWLPNNVKSQQEPVITPKEEFSEVLRSLGCIVNGMHPIMDGKTHRINVQGDKKGEQAGFYIGHLNGHPAGYVKNNRTGVEIRWKSKGYILTSEQKTKLAKESIDKLQIRSTQQQQLHEQLSERVTKQVNDLVKVSEQTAYMKSKGIEAISGIFTDIDKQKTYIPAFDVQGKQWTMQYVQEDGTKRFAKNSRKEGCFHVIGGFNGLSKSPVLVISEGFATAASISQVTKFPTIAAFDSGNLIPVAKALREKFPDKPIIIAGDDDKHVEITQGINPGRTKAEEAAKAVNGIALFPIFAPNEQVSNPKGFTDFNDLANKSILGVEGIERQIKPIVDKLIIKNNLRNNVNKNNIENKQKRSLKIKA